MMTYCNKDCVLKNTCKKHEIHCEFNDCYAIDLSEDIDRCIIAIAKNNMGKKNYDTRK